MRINFVCDEVSLSELNNFLMSDVKVKLVPYGFYGLKRVTQFPLTLSSVPGAGILLFSKTFITF